MEYFQKETSINESTPTITEDPKDLQIEDQSVRSSLDDEELYNQYKGYQHSKQQTDSVKNKMLAPMQANEDYMYMMMQQQAFQKQPAA